MDNSSNSNRDFEHTMKTISMEEYIKLVSGSVELYKAQRTIDRMTKSIKKKDATILELKKKLEFGNLSPVSL